MKEIVQWLRYVEHLASEVYFQAASIYANDPELKTFLENSAEDEAWHFHVMGSAAEFLASEPDFTPAISVDQETRDKIINHLNEIKIGLEQNALSRKQLLENIVTLELSEWNDIFLYVVNFLKNKTSEFKYPAARIQAHIKGIEHFFDKVEGRPQTLQKIKELPPVWIENILIADDEEMITELVKSLLHRSGYIDIVHNGQDALKKMNEKYYKLIVTDIDMPVMDGLTFYKEAVEKYPGSNNRFLFITGNLSPERQALFKEQQVKYIEKPMNIKVLRLAAEQIIISN